MDIVGNFQRGLAFGQEQKERKRIETERNQLRNLAPQIMQGDPAAYTQAATISPEAAGQYQSAGDSQYRRVTNVAKMMRDAINTNNPQAKQRAFQTILPFLQQLAGGRPVPEQWDDSLLPGFEQFENRISMAQAVPKEIPSGFQQFQLTAQAAGLQPGSPEYQQAARIALGQVGRASNAGYGFFEFEGADGRKRMGRNNPRTGQRELYDETTGQFVPLGSAAAPLPQGGTAAQLEQDMALANQMIAADIPEAQVDAFLAARTNPAQSAAPATAPAGLAVGRAPEEQAALTTGAQEAARLQYLPQAEQIKADAAVRQAGGVAQTQADVKRNAERAAAQVEKDTAFRLYQAGITGLSEGLAGSETGPIMGRIPAFTTEQQVAEGGVAAMAPILKQLFRSAGEGTFTDKDQDLLLAMIPTRTDTEDARKAKLANIDSLVRAKLGQGAGAAAPQNRAGGATIQRARNPQTGEVLVLRNGQWVPE